MKPLLLIVDDDTRVLEALEAELQPRFGADYAIETFGRAEELLRELPRWQTAQQEIALVIADQKMPGLTGLELVERLRSSRDEMKGGATGVFDPTRSARMMIITGYGGPEMAARALETRGVDLYREKPWQSGPLQMEVASLLLLFCDAGLSQSTATGEASDARADEILAAALRGAATEAPVELPSAETLLACAFGYASNDQLRELREALGASPQARRAIDAVLADLAELRRSSRSGSSS